MSSKTSSRDLPAISLEGSLSSYLGKIKKFPMLNAEEEYMLAKSWRERGDLKSAHKLVTSHLRLVARMAMGYRGYGLPVSELISEGNIGLMQAVKKFDPEKGFRLATYAMWWIKASIQEYILRSWSLVKIGTTTAQKKLFFNLKKIKNQIAPKTEGDLRNEHVSEIAEKLKELDNCVKDQDKFSRLVTELIDNLDFEDSYQGACLSFISQQRFCFPSLLPSFIGANGDIGIKHRIQFFDTLKVPVD